MRRFRFHIGTLVILVLLLAVGLAALRESNETWNIGVFTAALGMLLFSILLAVYRKESRRAFWMGFALFGSFYLGISLVPSIESRLLTTKVLVYLESKVPGRYLEVSILEVSSSGPPSNPAQNIAIITEASQAGSSIPGQVKIWKVPTGNSTENFVWIGHSFLALIAGLVGGQLSRQLSARTQESATL